VAFNKCNVLSLGHDNPKTDYYFETVLLENVDSVKDLGICISRDLRFSQYCRDISAKALARCAILFRSCRTKNKSVLLKAYTTYVRPLVEYETSVWSPYLKGDIRSVERVQRTFTRRLFDRCSLPPLEYEDRLSMLGLESLEYRRVKNDLTNTYKILHNKVEVNANNFFTICTENRTRSNGLKLYKEKPRLDVRKYFFSNRVVNW